MNISKDEDMHKLNPATSLGSVNNQANQQPIHTTPPIQASEMENSANEQTMITTATDTNVYPENSIGDTKYAGAVRRYGAVVIDSFLVGICTWIVSMVAFIPLALLQFTDNPIAAMILTSVTGLLQLVIWGGYYVYFIGSRGQTPGKMFFKIKIIKEETQNIPGYTTAFIREIIGNMLSAFIFGLGYLWIIWDSKKQGWHDKIAGTVALEDGELNTGKKLLLGFIVSLPFLAVMGVVAVIALIGFGVFSNFESFDQQFLPEEFLQEFDQLEQEMIQDIDSEVTMPDLEFNEN